MIDHYLDFTNIGYIVEKGKIDLIENAPEPKQRPQQRIERLFNTWSRIREMKEDKYAKSLAKSQVCANFNMRGKMFTSKALYIWRLYVGVLVPLRGPIKLFRKQTISNAASRKINI